MSHSGRFLSLMTWNWQQPDGPIFSYDAVALEPLEQQFVLQSGEFAGVCKHIGPDDQEALKVELISDEAVKSSEIGGEILDRGRVQSALRHQFGLGDEPPGVTPAERGIARMTADLYRGFASPLSDKTMFDWHAMLLSGDIAMDGMGGLRTRGDPQVVFGPTCAPADHFEAPPSGGVPDAMRRFIAWFNETAPGGGNPLPALTRAGMAHLHFVCIHPFEDGNGRIGRALAEKSLAQNLGQPSLIALADATWRKRKDYDAALARSSRENEITDWLTYFAAVVLEAQSHTIRRVDFHIAKAKFHDRLRGRLNERQDKVIACMFKEGIDGFKRGLCAGNYIGITETSRATATRDLQDLVEQGALTRTGELRHTRYFLNLSGSSAS